MTEKDLSGKIRPKVRETFPGGFPQYEVSTQEWCEMYGDGWVVSVDGKGGDGTFEFCTVTGRLPSTAEGEETIAISQDAARVIGPLVTAFGERGNFDTPDGSGFSPSDAVYGLLGWLTTGPSRSIGASEDCAVWAELGNQYCVAQGWAEPRRLHDLKGVPHAEDAPTPLGSSDVPCACGVGVANSKPILEAIDAKDAARVQGLLKDALKAVDSIVGETEPDTSFMFPNDQENYAAHAKLIKSLEQEIKAAKAVQKSIVDDYRIRQDDAEGDDGLEAVPV